MRIAELYHSLQGEGRLTGTESVFVRTSGCNLRCWFCDTPFASWTPEGQDLSVEEIVERVEAWECRHVVVTGGEPMLFGELLPLCERLSDSGHHLTIETAGTLYLPVACDLMSLSPKLSNSLPPRTMGRWRERHEKTRLADDVLRRLTREFDFQLKFVIDQPSDCDEVSDLLGRMEITEADRVWLMPQGTDLAELQNTAAWLEPYCLERGYHFCPRKHIEWFGPVRGV